MFYIRKRSIKYHETSRGMAFTAHLLQTGSDVHMGMVENRGVGGATSFLGATPHVDKLVQCVADNVGEPVSSLMEAYMDIAEGCKPLDAEQAELYSKLASYKPE